MKFDITKYCEDLRNMKAHSVLHLGATIWRCTWLTDRPVIAKITLSNFSNVWNNKPVGLQVWKTTLRNIFTIFMKDTPHQKISFYKRAISLLHIFCINIWYTCRMRHIKLFCKDQETLKISGLIPPVENKGRHDEHRCKNVNKISANSIKK